MNHSYFQNDIEIIAKALASLDCEAFEAMVAEISSVLKKGKKLILTGVGKNFPICEKVASSMQSTGLQVFALATDDALHGAMGLMQEGDMLLALSKSGETKELIMLLQSLPKTVKSYLLTFTPNSTLANLTNYQITMALEHEGDLWNVMPNNSITVSLILLQTMATQVQKQLGLELQKDFLAHHPGGAIGANNKRETV